MDVDRLTWFCSLAKANTVKEKAAEIMSTLGMQVPEAAAKG
jgi:hypothetical protein